MIERHGSSSHKITAAHLARKAIVYLENLDRSDDSDGL